jgi:hypothetical protein
MFKSDKIDLLLPFPSAFPFQDRRTALVFLWNNLIIKKIWKSLWYYRRYNNQMSDISWKKIDSSKRFCDFSNSLKNLKSKLTSKDRIKEIEEYIRYYKNRSKWANHGFSISKQLIYTILNHPKIIIYKVLSYLKW